MEPEIKHLQIPNFIYIRFLYDCYNGLETGDCLREKEYKLPGHIRFLSDKWNQKLNICKYRTSFLSVFYPIPIRAFTLAIVCDGSKQSIRSYPISIEKMEPEISYLQIPKFISICFLSNYYKGLDTGVCLREKCTIYPVLSGFYPTNGTRN